jgi:hypothetical protein
MRGRLQVLPEASADATGGAQVRERLRDLRVALPELSMRLLLVRSAARWRLAAREHREV